MESISKSLRKLSLNNKEDLHDLIIKKNTEFLENIHSKQVTERYHFDLPDFSKLEVDVKPDIIEDQTSLAFNKILFNKEYKNVRPLYLFNLYSLYYIFLSLNNRKIYKLSMKKTQLNF